MYSHDSSPRSAYCAATTLRTACARGSGSESSPLALRRANSSRIILMMARSRSSFRSFSLSAAIASVKKKKRLTLPLSPIAALCLPLLQGFFDSLQALYEFLLLAGLHGGAHGPDICVYGLDGHGRNVRLQFTLKQLAADLCILVPERAELCDRTAPAPALAPLRAVPSAFVCMVRMVHVAPLRTINRYPLTGRASLRNTSTFSQ